MHAVDVADPVVKRAMHRLGVTPEELQLKPKSAFYEPGLPEEVFEVRYAHYQHSLQATIDKLQASPDQTVVFPTEPTPTPGIRLSTAANQVEEAQKWNQQIVLRRLRHLKREADLQENIDLKLWRSEDARVQQRLALTPGQARIQELRI